MLEIITLNEKSPVFHRPALPWTEGWYGRPGQIQEF